MKKQIKITLDNSVQVLNLTESKYNQILAILDDKYSLIDELVDKILIINKWEKLNYNQLRCSLSHCIKKYITKDNIDECINNLKYILENTMSGDIFKTSIIDFKKYISKNNQLKFFNNKNLLTDICKISDRTFGEGELLFTLFTNCVKGKKGPDLYIINDGFKQIEIKGKCGRMGTSNYARKALDKYKKAHNIVSDTAAITHIKNNFKSLSKQQQIKLLYSLRTEEESIYPDYFKIQIENMLDEWADIDLDKLILAIQIYSYCSAIKANNLLLINQLNIANIEIDCLWGIYSQLLNLNLKITYSFKGRNGFGVTYNPA